MKTQCKNETIRLVKADLFQEIINRVTTTQIPITVLVPHVCNNIGMFSAGFAKEISNRYPLVKENFHLLGTKAKLGYTQFVDAFFDVQTNSKIVFANMIAQNGVISSHNPRPLNYVGLVRTMLDVKNYIHNTQLNKEINTELHCPKFGSGLAGGNWKFINELIEDIWDEFPVFVYER